MQNNPNSNHKPLSVSINKGCQILDIGRTKCYELINQEKIKTIKIGKKRLIVYSSLESLIGGEK